MSKIEVKNLSKSFCDKVVLNNVSQVFSPGSSSVILGKSGIGKSVFIKSIVGIVKPDENSEILIDDVLIDASNDEYFGNIGFLFQNNALFDSLTVFENVAFRQIFVMNKKRSELKDIVIDRLGFVGLSDDILHLKPSELSGGMQKRVALARLIMQNPSTIFLDEPTTGLDPIMSELIGELALKILQELKATMITITHDMKIAKKLGQKILFMNDGSFVWSGSKSDIETTSDAYISQFVNGDLIGPINI
jgi:phospholipid/cholesterol/gamma-HCH transport system ATP-binding protein